MLAVPLRRLPPGSRLWLYLSSAQPSQAKQLSSAHLSSAQPAQLSPAQLSSAQLDQLSADLAHVSCDLVLLDAVWVLAVRGPSSPQRSLAQLSSMRFREKTMENDPAGPAGGFKGDASAPDLILSVCKPAVNWLPEGPAAGAKP